MNRPRRGNSRRPENSAQIRKAKEKGRADLTRVVSPGCCVQSTKFATAIPAWGYAPSTMDADPAMPTRRIHVDLFNVVGAAIGIFVARYVEEASLPGPGCW